MVKPFLSDDFLLESETACFLYHQYAENEPVFDFHSHLSAEDIASDRIFESITEAWLENDHYKWRAMRWNGIDERLCTGPAGDRERFLAWAETVPQTLRNPLFHWTHLELKRYFNIGDRLLNPESADAIFRETGEMLRSRDFSTRHLLEKMNVSALCTTDDPLSGLEAHRSLAREGFEIRVLPTFRPDALFAVDDVPAFTAWIRRLEKAAGLPVRDRPSLLSALRQRHDFFHDSGCRLSDYSLDDFEWIDFPEKGIDRILKDVLTGTPPDKKEAAQFRLAMLIDLAGLHHERSWTMQLHMGASRNVNTRMHRRLGANKGFDSMSDKSPVGPVLRFLDRLAEREQLPKMILYNLHPRDSACLVTGIGNFQEGPSPGRIQYGPAWWFLDQKQGIIDQLNVLSSFGLLSRFVGMVTDSRSFLSFPRHEYFRRVFCNLLGTEVEKGEIPYDTPLLEKCIRGVCGLNARSFIQP